MVGKAVLHLLKAVQSSHTKEYAIHPFITAVTIPERNATLYVKSRRRQKYGSRKSDEGLECRCAKNSMYCSPLCCTFQRTTIEENFGVNYRRIDVQNRVADSNPLSHIYEELGLPPVGAFSTH
ncbi:unnamed protein product [Medioppia subpectinata]|uniref:Uncharacterized protein n=1 Tax=Medioppia subpectinata TaxID=1979941 RepID=A0A7R9Q7P3_9ACAR|nr:unnamed protein product [Medioppia subpectinata]CAG2114518.1 unnamed protein product [Medioppia subpectinata]